MSDYVNREEMLKRFDRRAKSTVGDKRVGVDSIRVFIENIPASDVVSREEYEQVRWERDVAIEQLSQIGKSFGEKMDDIATMRYGRWEWLGPNELVRGCMCGTCSVCKVRSKYITNTAVCPNCGTRMRGGE